MLDTNATPVCGTIPLTHPVRLKGEVIKGFGRGGKMLGIPTANLPAEHMDAQLCDVPLGVYVGWAHVMGQVYKSVLSIGKNPFFGNLHRTVEPHLIHKFDKDFYGEELKLVIVGWVRDMDRKFGSLDELIQAIQNDIEIGTQCLDDPQYKQYASDAYFEQSAPSQPGELSPPARPA